MMTSCRQKANSCHISALLMLMLALTGAAQEPQKEATTQQAQFHASEAAAQPMLIAPGDLLDITVYDEPEMTQEVRVEEGGRVNLSLIGSTKLSGMTAQQAGEWIAGELTRRRFLLKAQVTVLVKEFATQGVSVTGEVSHPGVYPVLGTRTLLDVISLAGGLTSMADTRVTIKHRSGTDEQVTVKLKGDDAQSSLDQNLQVYPGDLIIVPRAGIVYVLGDVNRPGGFVMQDNGKITLLEALAQAGGANHTAALNSSLLLHKGGAGYATDKIRVADLVRGRVADREMKPNDILFVPGSHLRYFAENSQGIASAVVGASVYHVIP